MYFFAVSTSSEKEESPGVCFLFYFEEQGYRRSTLTINRIDLTKAERPCKKKRIIMLSDREIERNTIIELEKEAVHRRQSNSPEGKKQVPNNIDLNPAPPPPPPRSDPLSQPMSSVPSPRHDQR
jgi:hypothetical protein